MGKKIGKLLLKGIVFTLIASWLWIHMSYAVMPELTHSRDNVYGYYAEPKRSLDTVFIGSSGTMSAFIPMNAFRDYGFTSYNFCINELAFQTYPFMIREALKTQQPKLLIIDVKCLVAAQSIDNMLTEEMEGELRYNTDPFRFSVDRFSYISKHVPLKNHLSVYFNFLKYHGRKLDFKLWNGSRKSVRKGYNFMGWGTDISYPEMTDEEIPLDPEVDRTLDDIFAECKSAGTNVLFLYYPHGETVYNEHPLQTVNYIEHRVKDAGFDFMNCSRNLEEFGFDSGSDYWNNGHWNILGAEKITAWLAPKLQSTYDLPDHRGDEAYSAWEEKIKSWEKTVKKQKKAIKKASGGDN